MITATEVKGSVLWYDEAKRFGFIKRDPAPGLPKDAKDIFVHKDAVEAAGLKELQKDVRLQFDIDLRDGREIATNIKPMKILGNASGGGRSGP